jgi:hypothetical protein
MFLILELRELRRQLFGGVSDSIFAMWECMMLQLITVCVGREVTSFCISMLFDLSRIATCCHLNG